MKRKIWIIAHPDRPTVTAQAVPVVPKVARQLRSEGFMIFVTEITLPPMFDTLAHPVESTPVQEQWEVDDAVDGQDPAEG